MSSLPVRSSVAGGLSGRRGGVSLGAANNGEVVGGALNQGDAPADALDKFLVAAAFDRVVREKSKTNLTVCQNV